MAMGRSLLIVLAVGVLLGFAAGRLWGRWVGVGVGVLAIVAAAVVLVLRRNQTDLRELEMGKTPGEGDDLPGGDARR
jgi:hypothetical protein